MSDIETAQYNLRLRVETREKIDAIRRVLYVRSPADVIDRAVAELHARVFSTPNALPVADVLRTLDGDALRTPAGEPQSSAVPLAEEAK